LISRLLIHGSGLRPLRGPDLKEACARWQNHWIINLRKSA